MPFTNLSNKSTTAPAPPGPQAPSQWALSSQTDVAVSLTPARRE